MRSIGLIARTVLLEAVRRKELYLVVIVSLAVVAFTFTIDFFNLDGLAKFHREITLKLMGWVTGFTAIVLASRQLPREFEQRTIYPMLAKPVTRLSFLLGKLLGVLLAALFCYGMFMIVFCIGTLMINGDIPWGLLGQHIYLQLLSILILSCMAFWLSQSCNLDAAITIGVIFYLLAASYSSMLLYLYEYSTAGGQLALRVMNYVIPQLALLDLSGKVIHAESWSPLAWGTMMQLTVYAVVYTFLFFLGAFVIFRRRSL